MARTIATIRIIANIIKLSTQITARAFKAKLAVWNLKRELNRQLRNYR